jgi:hypothetical protein
VVVGPRSVAQAGPALRLARLVPSLLLVAVVACVDYRACGSPRRRLDFGPLDHAVRIRVGFTGYDTHRAEISDPDKIRAARVFLERHRDGWLSSWTGNSIGARRVVFLPAEGEQWLGEFSFSDDYIATRGLYQRLPPAEISALASSLGVKWPPDK